jgi:hypothetical protein
MAGFTLAVVAALLAAPAQSSRSSPPDDPSKKICVREAKIGTRLTRTRCLTEAQWREMRRESRELTQWLQQIGDIAGAR